MAEPADQPAYKPAFPKPEKHRRKPRRMKRSGPLRPNSPTNAQGRWESEEYRAFIREKPCSGHGSDCPARRREVMHLVSRGSRGSDFCNAVPACRECHRFQHQKGWTAFEENYGVSRSALLIDAAKYTEQWLIERENPLRQRLYVELGARDRAGHEALKRGLYSEFGIQAAIHQVIARILGERHDPWRELR